MLRKWKAVSAILVIGSLPATSLVQTNLEPPAERWLDSYLVAPLDAIKLIPTESSFKRELLDLAIREYHPFSQIKVVEREGSKVLFQVTDGIVVGWVDEKFVISSSAFKKITNWAGPYELQVCREYYGCNSVRVESNGYFLWEHSPPPGEECYFEPKPQGQWNDWEDWAVNGWDGEYVCSTDGRVERYRDYLRFRSTWSLHDEMLFQVGDDGRLCWIEPLQLHDVCMPLEAEYLATPHDQ